MHALISHWRTSLANLLSYYEQQRGPLRSFFPQLFAFFVLLNIACYWIAMFTAFPELTTGSPGAHYFKVQFPVGLLGALFDSLSFFVTVYIIRRALKTRKHVAYLGHLSIDLGIALLATCWVVFVFSVSGWIINLLEANPDLLAVRNARYQQMVVDALAAPADNLRNIYFGLVMGISAMLPTCLHLFLFFRSGLQAIYRA